MVNDGTWDMSEGEVNHFAVNTLQPSPGYAVDNNPDTYLTMPFRLYEIDEDVCKSL